MKSDADDWERLNGYADGELDAAAAAAIEARLAGDPGLAAELSRIRAVKQGLSVLHPSPAHSRPSRRPLARRLAAAAAVLVLATAGLAHFWFGGDRDRPANITEIHRAFSEQTYFVDLDRQILVSAGAAIGEIDAPDLTPSNLALVDMRTFEGMPRIALHYRGRRGCRVTLMADAIESAPFGDTGAASLVYVWQTPTRRFALIADGMDENRFAAIGAFAEALSQDSEHQREFRTALVERTEAARPCA